MSGQDASSSCAYVPALPPTWNPLMNCYTGYFWSYGANAWMPYMEVAPAQPARTRSRSCASSNSSYSYSYASSYASSYSSMGSKKSSGRSALRKREIDQDDRGRTRHSSRTAGHRARSVTRNRRSRSRNQNTRVAHIKTGGQERGRVRSPPRRADVRGTSRETRKHRGEFSCSRGGGKVAHLDRTVGRFEERTDWEEWNVQAGNEEDKSWGGSWKWPSWKWTQGQSWKWSKKRNNKKRGGWRVQAKRAARSRPSERTDAKEHSDRRDAEEDALRFQEADAAKIDDVSGSSDSVDVRRESIREDEGRRSHSMESSNSSERSE